MQILMISNMLGIMVIVKSEYFYEFCRFKIFSRNYDQIENIQDVFTLFLYHSLRSSLSLIFSRCYINQLLQLLDFFLDVL